MAYSLDGDDARALDSLRQALSIQPDFLRALQAEASILSRRKDPEAIPVLEKILAKEPHDAVAHEMLALAEAQAGECAAALRDFAEAAPAATHVMSLQHRAACLLQTRAYSEAIAA